MSRDRNKDHSLKSETWRSVVVSVNFPEKVMDNE